MKEQIRTAIENTLKNLGIEGVDFAVDFPTDKSTNADYFSNVAMVAAGKVGQAPRAITRGAAEHHN
jgi:arginyl-tRNA synthetase